MLNIKRAYLKETKKRWSKHVFFLCWWLLLLSLLPVFYKLWADFSNLYIWYICFCAFAGIILLITAYFQNKYWRLTETLKYVFVGGLYMFGIHLLFASEQHEYAIEISVFFATVPLLFFDRPYRIWIISFVFLLIYISTSFYFVYFTDAINKFGAYSEDLGLMFTIFIVNGSSYFFIGQFLMVAVKRMHTRDLENIESVTNERDTDILTTFPNRRNFNASFALLNDKSGLHAVIMMDIDLFKKYNDLFGHMMGDDALHQVGVTLVGIAAKYGIDIYRYGGEEFVGLIVKPDVKVRKVCEEIIQNVYNLGIRTNTSKTGKLTMSVGYSLNTRGKIEKYSLLKSADNALFRSKTRGDNTYSKSSK